MKKNQLLTIFICLQFLIAGVLQAQDFVHPGILHKESDFARMRQKVAEKAEPWYTTWNNLLASPESQIGWVGPRATATVIRGGTGDNISLMYRDVAAAYQNALIYKISGDKAHGDKAVAILNAWASINTLVSGNADRYLASGLNGYQFANAAEMMRGYPGFDIEKFKSYMLNVFYYPMNERFILGNSWGAAHNDSWPTNYRVNWDICNMNAMLAISILCDNKVNFYKAINYCKSGSGNGNINRAVNFLYPNSPATGANLWGQWEESGRDQGHATGGMGLYGLFCEIAWNQGVDVYGYDDCRYRKGAEYVARYNISDSVSGLWKYNDLPFTTYTFHQGPLTGGSWTTESGISSSVRGKYGYCWEAIYNHYANRLNQPDKVQSVYEILKQQGSVIWPSIAIHADTYDTPGGEGLTLHTDSGSSVLPWLNMDLCARSISLLPNYGKTTLVDSTLTIKGSGTGINGTSDFCQYTFQQLYDDGAIVVKMSSLDEVNAFCQSGLMMRESLEQNSANVFLSLSTARGAIFSSRDVAGGATSIVASNINLKAVPCWLRLSRLGNLFTASVSSDNINWVIVGSKTLSLNRNLYVGMAVSSNTQNAVCTAVFENSTFTQANMNMKPIVTVSSPEAGSTYATPAYVTISGTAYDIDGTLSKSEIYVNDSLVSTSLTSSFTYSLTRVASGAYSVYVKAYDTQGAVQTSDTLKFVVNAKTTAMPWYKFDETQAVSYASDASGNNVTATLYGNPVFVAGKINNGIKLNGVNNYVEIPDGLIERLSDFSVSTWVNMDSAATWSRIFDFGSGTASTMYLTGANGSGKMEFRLLTGIRGSQTVQASVALPTKTWNFVTVTLGGDTLKIYLNGTLVGSAAAFTLRPYDLGKTTANYIGKSQYPDPYFKGTIDDFRLFNYALSSSEIADLMAQATTPPAIVTNLSSSILTLDELNTTGSFTVSGLNLTNNIMLTAPTGITVSPTTIASNALNTPVTVTYNGTTTPINGNIVLTSGSVTQNVAVNAMTNATCFAPLYPTGNIIVDPICNSYTTDGWGTKGINTDPTYVYCGDKSGMINSGSYDRVLTGVMKINTKYRVKAKVWKVSGTVGIGVYGWNGTAADIYKEVTTAGSWQDVDFTFTTSATLKTTGQGVFFNSGTGYIDNWEMYEVPRIILSSSSLTYSGAGTKKVAVTGSKLTSNISITVPTGFTVSPATLPSTAAGDSLSITFDGVTTTSGYVYLTSGEAKDSIQIAATAYPAITTSPSSLSFDELNRTGSFTVTGANIVNDITITTPTGITVNSTTIPASRASNATILVTYDGTTTPVNGNVVLTSGSFVKNVAVAAATNSSCFTPLYPTGNKIADPHLNSLSTFAGWGTKSINTDPAYVYCGSTSGKITGASAGSIDISFPALKSYTRYRMRAMVLTIGGTFRIGMNNLGSGVANIDRVFNTNGAWMAVDIDFTTGSGATCNLAWFNNYQLTGTTGYIDNWEFYEVPKINHSPASLNFVDAGIKKVAVTANNLASNISITAPSGFTVSPSTLSQTAAGDSIAIAFDGLAARSGYVYLTSDAVKDSILVTGILTNAITFPALPAKLVGDVDFSPGATASSGLVVSYTSSNVAVATIVNGNIHIVGAGTSVITASQAGDATYNAAIDVTQTLTVSKKSQTITLAALPAKLVGDADFAPGATASSGLAVSYASSNVAVATIVNGDIHIVGAGTAIITASQAGNATYSAAIDATQTLTVSKRSQTITFAALPANLVGDVDFSPGATASSGLAVSYTSSNVAVATIVNGNIHIVGAGTTVITASQAGDASYNAAADMTQTLTVTASVNYKIKNRSTSLYIDGMGRTVNGNATGQWSSSTSSNQNWIIETVGSYVKLKNVATGLYIDGMGLTTSGSTAAQWSSSTSPNQQWLQVISSGYTKFKNRATGLYLDGMGLTANGSNLGQKSLSTNKSQQWVLTQNIALVKKQPTIIPDEVQSEIEIYPNLVQTELIISSNGSKYIQVELYNLLGKLVKSEKFAGDNMSVNLDALASGIYIVKVNAGLKSMSKNIIKK